jgi:hypothetical protein
LSYEGLLTEISAEVVQDSCIKAFWAEKIAPLSTGEGLGPVSACVLKLAKFQKKDLRLTKPVRKKD